MRTSLFTLTLVSMLGLTAGCTTKPTGPKPGDPPYTACQHVTESVKTCFDLGGGNWVCPVALSKNSTGLAGVAPFTLRAKANANVVVVWSISGDANAVFQSGDGPTWPEASQTDLAAITDAGPVADSNGQGSTTSQAQPYYRIRLATPPTMTTQSLKYNIKYHDGSGNEVLCDPFINNSGG